MKNLIVPLTILICTLLSCEKEKLSDPAPRDPSIRYPIYCVTEEAITDTSTYVQNYQPGEQMTGKASAIKTNTAWEATAVFKENGVLPDNYIMTFNTYSESGYEREVIGIYDIPLKTGCYSLNDDLLNWYNDSLGISLTISTDDGDALLGGYSIDLSEPEKNIFELTEVDTIGNIVKGKFSFSMVTNTAHGDPDFPPGHPMNIRFFNGTFEAKILK